MLTLICLIFTFGLVGSLIKTAFKLSWGVLRIVFSVVILPLLLVGAIIGGLFYIAIPALIILGFISLILALTKAV